MPDAAHRPSAFLDAERFAFVPVFERHWREIHAEYRAVREHLVPYVEEHLYGTGWQVYGLWNLPHREPFTGQAERCPLTKSLIERHVPSHGAVAFSVLCPGTRIRPHEGKAGPFLRCHLALEVPAGDCALEVAGEQRRWEPGRAFVFDDHHRHAAWNLTGEERVVLLFDFVP
jgi:beta-hydroxylase